MRCQVHTLERGGRGGLFHRALQTAEWHVGHVESGIWTLSRGLPGDTPVHGRFGPIASDPWWSFRLTLYF
eukprot:scaffold615085_cov18-Prasinocladus_malaysianus.AAC.1